MKKLSFLFFLFTLYACSYEIKMKATINNDCSVNINIIDGEPQIRYILMTEERDSKPNLKTIVWEANGNLKYAKHFTYGELPNGFSENTAPSPLKNDTNYYFIVKGSGGGYGMTKIEYKCLTKSLSGTTNP